MEKVNLVCGDFLLFASFFFSTHKFEIDSETFFAPESQPGFRGGSRGGRRGGGCSEKDHY